MKLTYKQTEDIKQQYNKGQISLKTLAKIIMNLPNSCQICGTIQNLTIERIKPLVYHPELALEPSNLTTLCRSCNSRNFNVCN